MPAHCLNIFVPLVDVEVMITYFKIYSILFKSKTKTGCFQGRNGGTEFCLGSHFHSKFMAEDIVWQASVFMCDFLEKPKKSRSILRTIAGRSALVLRGRSCKSRWCQVEGVGQGPLHMISYHMILYQMISYHMIMYHMILYHQIMCHMIMYHIISHHMIM